MILSFGTDEFERIPETSSYNHNYYNHKFVDCMILEVCHEDENWFEFFMVEDGKEIFIGSSSNGIGNTPDIELEFKVQYT